MNEPMRTPELKFFRRADLVERDPPVEEPKRNPLFRPLVHMLRLEVS